MYYQNFAASLKEQVVSFFDAFPRLEMTLPDEYERAALGEYSENEEASDDERDQHDGNGVSSFEPTRLKLDPDIDIEMNK